jgi:hypothetical protein
MKKLVGPVFEHNRIPLGEGYRKHLGIPKEQEMGDEWNGCFVFKNPFGVNPYLRIIASAGDGWDHVSVSTESRCPTWAEMDWVKRLFFEDFEIAFQLHVTPKDHINIHPNVLHIWRPHKQEIPLPPVRMV